MQVILSSFWFNVVVLTTLLFLSAFFSGSETALFSLSRARIRQLREKGGRAGRRTAELLRFPKKLLTTILVGNLIVNIALSSILAILFREQFGVQGAAIAIPTTAFLLLIFGEVTPKTFAILRPILLAKIAAPILSILTKLLTPIRFVLRLITNLILIIFRQGNLEKETILTREEFQATLRAGKIEGGVEQDEAGIIHSITSFKTMSAKEIMVPRFEMKAVSDKLSLRESIKICRKYNCTQIPVFKDNIDNVWGILKLKSIPEYRQEIPYEKSLSEIFENLKKSKKSKIISKAFLIPELCNVDSLLIKLKNKQEQIAILLDEYGGTSGMVTRDTILDALLGGLVNYSPEKTMIRMRPNGDVITSGRTRLSQLSWECGFHFSDEEEIVSGYIMRKLGAVPKPGQTFNDRQYEFCVLQMKKNRIEVVRIREKK